MQNSKEYMKGAKYLWEINEKLVPIDQLTSNKKNKVLSNHKNVL